MSLLKVYKELSRAADLYFVLFNLSCKLWVGRGLLWSSWCRFSRAAGPQAQIWCQSTRANLGSWARGPRRRCCGSGIITEPQDLYFLKSGNKRKKKQKCVILLFFSEEQLHTNNHAENSTELQKTVYLSRQFLEEKPGRGFRILYNIGPILHILLKNTQSQKSERWIFPEESTDSKYYVD